MALITCKECQKQVSDEAKNCPSCGAPVPKPTSRLAIFIAGFFGLIVFLSIYNSNRSDPPSAATPQQAAVNTAQKLIDDAKEKEFQVVVIGAKMLKKSTKNPDSFVLTSAVRMADGTICYEFRGTNSFNAIVPGHYTLAPKKGSDTAADWNKYCAGKSGTDYTYARRAL